MSRHFYRDPCASLKVRRSGSKRSHDHFSNSRREDVLSSNLNHARTAGTLSGEKSTEVEVVREDHQPVCFRVLHNFSPVEFAGPRLDQWTASKPRSSRNRTQDAQIHIDQNFHSAGIGISISSTRQAA